MPTINIYHKLHIDYLSLILILASLLAGYIKYALIIMTIVIFHELGHVFFLRQFKIEYTKIIIYPFGGVTYTEMKIHERFYKKILISLGGIIFQIILFLTFKIFLNLSFIKLNTYNIFLKYNTSILLFNLLPIIPLDGSKALNSLLLNFISFTKVYFITVITSSLTLLILIIISFHYQINNISLYFFLFYKLYDEIKNYRYLLNKFYLERILYHNYYNKIIRNHHNIKNMKVNKYYYFNYHNSILNEKEYLSKIIFKKY